jgi:hypothetical protein
MPQINLSEALVFALTGHAWSIGELLDAAPVIATPNPKETAPDRQRRFRVIEGEKL